MTRYALYFAPAQDSPWWKAGCHWLGRDAHSGADSAQPTMPGMPHLLLSKLTSDARRYGFHATLKAPFRLASGFTEAHLLAMARKFCDAQQPVPVGPLDVRTLGQSLVLRGATEPDGVTALATRCLAYFDLLRADATESELQKYRDKGLDAHQEELLQRWGYPYTEDQFRFHLTLTDDLSETTNDMVEAMQSAAQAHFARVLEKEPLHIDALTIFREDAPGSPFIAWKRIEFNRHIPAPAIPEPGKLIYFIGAADAGSDLLLQCVKNRYLADGETVVAQRTITRPAISSEPHEPVDDATFWQLAQDGHFTMLWQANGLCYGIRSSIEVDLAMGRTVIVNGVRDYLPQLRRTFPHAQVVWLDDSETAARTQIGIDAHAEHIDDTTRIDSAASLPCSVDCLLAGNCSNVQSVGSKIGDLLQTRG